MRRNVKWILSMLAAVLFSVSAAAAGWYLYRAIPIGTGYAAKYLCSAVFVSGRNAQEAFQVDVAPVNILARIIDFRVNDGDRSVTATALGIRSRAIFREGCGCTLIAGTSEQTVRKQRAPRPRKIEPPADAPWPQGRKAPVSPLPEGIDSSKLNAAIENAFEEQNPEDLIRTRAVVVVYDGQLIAERYAPGFDKDTALPGWSMSKSITNALAGILVKAGKLELFKPAPVPEWRDGNDARHRITLDQLLRMSSGLAFEEIYEPLYDVTEMLFRESDFGAFAAAKHLESVPDDRWSYSSGTANLISRLIRQTVGGTWQEYVNFPKSELFEKLGMQSAVLEPDPSGTFVGSSYAFADARDWARFGLLYLNDGVWQGERILPEGWVVYSTTPTPKAPLGQYGAHFWLNAGNRGKPEERRWPKLPSDAYFAMGFQGQSVCIIPSRRLVVVRLGLTVNEPAWDLEGFVSGIIDALPDEKQN